MEHSAPIIVFDSGYGGISVLKKLVVRMPTENYLYFGDSLHAPYGPRPAEEVCSLTLDAIRSLLHEKPKAVVIACNTATAAALECVRQLLPDIPVVGIRPALQQAEAAGCRRILSMATAGTLASPSYAQQLQKLQSQTRVISVAAPGIVRYVEDGMTAREEFLVYLRDLLLPVGIAEIDSVVLGCTHFPFAKEELRAVLGCSIPFFDASDDVAAAVSRLLETSGPCESSSERGSVTFLNSLNTGSAIGRAWKLFAGPC